MANVKISQLPSLSTMTDLAQIPVVAGGTTYQITGANLSSYFGGNIITAPVAYSTLTATAGARAFVNDGNLVASGNFGAQVSGGGSNTVPVWSNGTNWYVG